ncbi:MAG: hypothetical protein QXS50_05115, partial [Candidatus Caldarchaeum sp.]
GADERVELDKLRETCRAKLAEYKQPSEFIVFSELPKSLVGKMLRRRVKEMIYQKIGGKG